MNQLHVEICIHKKNKMCINVLVLNHFSFMEVLVYNYLHLFV
jgi:hypothetical protein